MSAEAAGVRHELLNEFMPLGVIVTDSLGTIRYANARACDMIGYLPVEVIDQSILDHVHEDDTEFVVASLLHGTGYPGMIMGPSRIRYRHRDGEPRWTEYWAHECPSEFGFEGFIITMATESVTDNLQIAVTDIAAGASLDACLASITRAVSGYPLVAVGSVLLVGDDRFTAVGEWPFDSGQLIDDRAMPWWTTHRNGVGVDLEIDDLPDHARRVALAAGFQSIWVRPIISASGKVPAMFVAWRVEPGFASPNQERHLASAVDVARLAFDHHEYLGRLQRVAMTDHLTGVGNRAALTAYLGGVHDEAVAALYIDLDHFKAVNDNYGHDRGDDVLVAAAQRVSSLVGSDRLFRIGGDEFVVLVQLPADSLVPRAVEIANAVVAGMTLPLRIGEEALSVGASVGVAVHQPGESAEAVIRRADAALMLAKRAGKGCWRAHPDDAAVIG